MPFLSNKQYNLHLDNLEIYTQLRLTCVGHNFPFVISGGRGSKLRKIFFAFYDMGITFLDLTIQVTGPQMVYGPQTVDHDLFCPQTWHFHNFCLKITPNSLYMSFFTKNNFLSKFVKMHRFYRVANIIGHFLVFLISCKCT